MTCCKRSVFSRQTGKCGSRGGNRTNVLGYESNAIGERKKKGGFCQILRQDGERGCFGNMRPLQRGLQALEQRLTASEGENSDSAWEEGIRISKKEPRIIKGAGLRGREFWGRERNACTKKDQRASGRKTKRKGKKSKKGSTRVGGGRGTFISGLGIAGEKEKVQKTLRNIRRCRQRTKDKGAKRAQETPIGGPPEGKIIDKKLTRGRRKS